MTDPDPAFTIFKRRVTIAVFANFFLFGLISLLIGGDAINGTNDGGIYLLSAAGRDTQVSALVWYYSLFHAYITIGTFLLYFAFSIILRRSARHAP